MKTTIKTRSVVVIVLIILFFTAIFSKIIYTLINDHQTLSKTLLMEHYNLFTKDAQRKLELLATTTSKNREVTSHYVYNGRFDVFVLKVILSTDSDHLENIIKFQTKESNISMNAVYSGLANYNMTMDIKSGASVKPSIVHFNFSGDSIKSIANNDSLYCYYYQFKTFSINYNDEPYDVIAKANQSSIPASLIFKRKGKFLYIIIMTVAKGEEKMQANQLYDILNR